MTHIAKARYAIALSHAFYNLGERDQAMRLLSIARSYLERAQRRRV